MNKRIYQVLTIITIAFIGLGCFWDLQISQKLYEPTNPFAIFFAAFGESPALIISWLGFQILCPIYKEEGNRRVFCIIIILMVAPMYVFVETFIYYKNLITISLFMQAVICYGIATILYRLVKSSQKQQLKKLGWLCCILPTTQILVVLILKLLVARGRYRSVVLFDDLPFREFYQIDYSLRAYFLQNHLLDIEEFFSFPSGHTANAACILAINYIPSLINKKEQKWLFYSFSIIFTCLVGYSRIIMGAHYLTDICFGFLVTLFLMKLIYHKIDIKL